MGVFHGALLAKKPLITLLGILKNSYHRSPPNPAAPLPTEIPSQSLSPDTSNSGDLTCVSADPDITLANTLQNAGHRRNSSNPRGSVSRRQSTNPALDEDPNNPRLKWDEVNLYLTEQEKSSTMKIDEPKTPYAKRYEPDEDEEEMRTLDAADLKVDELDQVGGGRSKTREAEIPGLELGDPEDYPELQDDRDRISRSSSTSAKAEKQVIVEPTDDSGAHGENVGLSAEEKEKHKKFEEMRKKHYEMKDVKGLLGYVLYVRIISLIVSITTNNLHRHPEELEDMDEDDDSTQGPTEIPQGLPNGS